MGRQLILFMGAIIRFILFYPIRKFFGMKTFDFYTYLHGPEKPENWEDSVNYYAANIIAFIGFMVVMAWLLK